MPPPQRPLAEIAHRVRHGIEAAPERLSVQYAAGESLHFPLGSVEHRAQLFAVFHREYPAVGEIVGHIEMLGVLYPSAVPLRRPAGSRRPVARKHVLRGGNGDLLVLERIARRVQKPPHRQRRRRAVDRVRDEHEIGLRHRPPYARGRQFAASEGGNRHRARRAVGRQYQRILPHFVPFRQQTGKPFGQVPRISGTGKIKSGQSFHARTSRKRKSRPQSSAACPASGSVLSEDAARVPCMYMRRRGKTFLFSPFRAGCVRILRVRPADRSTKKSAPSGLSRQRALTNIRPCLASCFSV